MSVEFKRLAQVTLSDATTTLVLTGPTLAGENFIVKRIKVVNNSGVDQNFEIFHEISASPTYPDSTKIKNQTQLQKDGDTWIDDEIGLNQEDDKLAFKCAANVNVILYGVRKFE